MKILEVCAVDFSLETLLVPLIKMLMEKGFIVHCVCQDTGRFPELRKQGLHMIDIAIDRKIRSLSNIQSITRLYMLMRRGRYDIVHVHTPVASVLGRLAAKLAGVKHVIYTVHGFHFHEGMSKLSYMVYYSIEKFFARFFTEWLFLVSGEDYELCLRKRFKESESIFHVGNGVDIYSRFNPNIIDQETVRQIRSELGIKENDVVFSFVGRFVREKGIFELVDAFRQLRQERAKVKLLIIGNLLPSERDKSAHALIRNTDPDIIITGYRRDIPELLAISDIFVLPSHREGLPISILEAMAIGKPIVATNIRGCREEVVHGENGFLIKKGDIKELYQRMLELVDDPKMRRSFGLKSREIVEKYFDETRVIQRQLELFQKTVFDDIERI